MGKTKLGITRFFTGLLKNLHKLFFANVLFAIPFIGFTSFFYFLNTLTGWNLSFIYYLPVIFVFPFYSGITVITRKIVKEETDIPVFKIFINSFKENLSKFIVHAIVLYAAIFFCYTSITLYWRFALENGIYFVMFGIAVVIAIVLLFMFFNIPVMTVTFELSLKNIYKNAFLMTFGELKNNFFAALGLFLLFIFSASIFFTATNAVVLMILTLFVVVFIVPSVASYIMNFYVYKGMESIMINKNAKSEQLQDKIRQEKAKKNNAQLAKEILDFSNVDLDEKKDGEEYLYFNGKMIKRRILIEMKKKQERENG